MNDKQFIDEIVGPTIAELEREPTCRRRAFLACVVTFHALDYFERDKEARKALCEQTREDCADFETIERVANAFKHPVSSRKPLKVQSIVERPPLMCGVGQCGLSQTGDTIGGVEIWGEDGPDILPALKRTEAFLREKVPGLLPVEAPSGHT